MYLKSHKGGYTVATELDPPGAVLRRGARTPFPWNRHAVAKLYALWLVEKAP